MSFQEQENQILALLQCSSPPPNFGGAPAWSSFPNSQYPQGLIDYYLNEGYKQLLTDCGDFELVLTTITFLSTAQTSQYAIPGSVTVGVTVTPCPAISTVAHVYYQPVGLPYTREYEPGERLISWSEFQKWTGQGYLRPYSYGTEPSVATIDPTRKFLCFYPGSASVGDTITVSYVPIPTTGAIAVTGGAAPGIATSTGCPKLVAETDSAMAPAETHIAIVYWALSQLWVKARELQTADRYASMYREQVADIRRKYMTLSRGDTFRVKPFGDALGIGGIL